MQIAAQHAETVSQRPRIRMKERFLLNGIALHPTHISPGYVKRATLVVAHFANPGLAIGNGTGMTAGITAHAVAIKFFVEFAFADVFVDDIAKGGHATPLDPFYPSPI